MARDRTIALCGISDEDKIVFSSLLNIISFKTAENWVLTGGVSSDVIVVNVDTHRGQAYLRKPISDALLVKLGQGLGDASDEHLHLRRPLRARDILACLEIISKRTLREDEWKMVQGKF